METGLNNSVRKILLIGYHFYPDLQVGAQRTIKFAKYLPEFGWQPHILTVDSKYYPQLDTDPLGFDCPVHRTCKWILPDDLYRAVKQRLGFGRNKSAPAMSHSSAGPAGEIDDGPPRVPLYKKFLNSLSQTPDGSVGWYIPAVFAAVRLNRRYKFDAIYTSGPPHTAQMIGLTVHRLTGVPWVADFRDPWLYPKERDAHVLNLTKRFDVRYEDKTARHASLVLTTTDEWRDALKKRYHPTLDSKCRTLINGFDTDDFPAGTSDAGRDRNDPVRFLYAGNLYYGRDPSTMLEAAGELVREGRLGPDDFAFDFYGNNDIDMNRVDRIVSDYRLEPIVQFKPPVSRDKYLKLLQQADVLILIQADQGKVHIPAKAFEYLGTGRSILTLTSEGSTRNFMSRFDHVMLAKLHDREEIKRAIIEVVECVRKGASIVSRVASLEDISKRSLTKQFAAMLNEITPAE